MITPTLPPQVGMVATVRNRRGVVSGVQPFDGPDGRLHLVDLEYNDGYSPREESLLWEREAFARLLPPAALPDPASDDPMSHDDLIALVRACRWSARMPFIDPDAEGPLDRLPVSSPFHGAVQVEDYQLMPLLKALRMPRVSLLIADDVGLGKTVEAGLILSELLLRRRIRRVLVMTPASLRVQWRDELWEKFSLNFDIVDRDSTDRLRREVGLDANPWRSFSRIVTSYHYLKQPDILEQFRSASRHDEGKARLPWDLLIVDEAHNLTPVPIGEESDLCTMLRQVAPLFEHRIFLTATPHNGHTRSFTGLLEMLDPVRFSQTNDLKSDSAMKARIPDVLVRRLKREINERSDPKKFSDRHAPNALLLAPAGDERAVSTAFSAFREKIHQVIAAGTKSRRLAGNFAIEILGKRLLSCPVTFAESWRRVREGFKEAAATSEEEVLAARRKIGDETVDDRESESLSRAASVTVGSWLKPIAAEVEAEIRGIENALAGLGLLDGADDMAEVNPPLDVRYGELLRLIRVRLQREGEWIEGERLVIFTEYKTTLDYLLRRLREDLDRESRVLCLFGGMADPEREDVKKAFNDSSSEVRILVATDAASEGLNLQETARFLLHYDVPWNPSRLEQRNGRLDRHGQPRDVETWHFASNDDQDLDYLDYVVRKVDTIREDLGACGDVFDEATHRRLIEGRSLAEVKANLDERVAESRKRGEIPRDASSTIEQAGSETDPAGDLEAIASELDFDPRALYLTLDAAMAISAGRPRVTVPNEEGRSRIVQPCPSSWTPVVNDSLRLPTRGGSLGALRDLAFDPEALIVSISGRLVFRPRLDTALVRLSHPVIQKALSTLTRQRFPGAAERAVSRWGVFIGDVPENADAVIHLTFEELAVNELRETFHHWVRTIRIPVAQGRLLAELPHLPAGRLPRPAGRQAAKNEIDAAREIWLEARKDLRDRLKKAEENLSGLLLAQLEEDRVKALRDENERYKSRQAEVSALIESSTMAKLEREVADLKTERDKGWLFDDGRLDVIDKDIAIREEELKRRKRHYEEVRDQLAGERERIIRNLIPNRYTMRGTAQIMPVAVEIFLRDQGDKGSRGQG